MAVPKVGDRVLLNVAALERGLGTGGYALVIAVLDPDGQVTEQPPQPAGHLVKARYMPLQAMVAGADEQGSRYHELLRDADSMAGMPVVVADLHSALAPILLAVRHDRPQTRVVYVMTDQGALPIAFSRSVAELRAAGLLAATVTVGQAFGGDLEAVTVHSGLLAARLALEADLVVVTQGPGNLGTGTRWGFSGVGAGEAINAAGDPRRPARRRPPDLRRRPAAAPSGRVAPQPDRVRAGGADRRPTWPCRTSPAPRLAGIAGLTEVAALADEVTRSAAALTRHRQVLVELDGLDQALRDSPVPLSTMGRDLDADPAYFLASAAGGRHAAAPGADIEPTSLDASRY